MLAHSFWPPESPLGQRVVVDLPERHVMEIVGVVGDIRSESVQSEDWPTVYAPFAQEPMASVSLAVRTAGSPHDIAAAVRHEVSRLDASQPVADVRTLEEVVDRAVS